MTGSEFYAYVLRKFKRTDKSTEAYEAMGDVIADMRLRYPFNDYKIETTLTGISSLGDYALNVPSNFLNLLGDITLIDTGTDEDLGTLRKISKEEFDRKYSERFLSSSSLMDLQRPYEYCVFGNQVYVAPIPDKLTYSYKATIVTEPVDEVTSGTAAVPFTDSFYARNTLRSGVLAELFNGMENYEEAQYWDSKYKEGLDLMARKDDTNNTDDMSVVYNGL